MSNSTKKTQTQIVKEELAPKVVSVEPTLLSEYKPKDSLFCKEKTYIDRKSGQQRFIEADWLNIHVGGQAVVLHKGVNVLKTILAAFNDDAKAYYLTKN